MLLGYGTLSTVDTFPQWSSGETSIASRRGRCHGAGFRRPQTGCGWISTPKGHRRAIDFLTGAWFNKKGSLHGTPGGIKELAPFSFRLTVEEAEHFQRWTRFSTEGKLFNCWSWKKHPSSLSCRLTVEELDWRECFSRIDDGRHHNSQGLVITFEKSLRE